MRTTNTRRSRRDWASPTFLLMATAFVYLRVFALIGLPPIWHVDVGWYREGVGLLGGHKRPWMYPLLLAITGPNWIVVTVQVLIGCTAFVLLAALLLDEMRDRRVGIGAAAAVLLVGLSPRIVGWDRYLLTESLAISLTCLLIVAWRRARPAFGDDGHAGWVVAFVAIWTLWLFARDAHLFLGLLAAPVIAWRLWRTARPASIAAVIVLIWCGLASTNNDRVEQGNTAANIAWWAPEAGDVNWFIDNGMPADTVWIDEPFAWARYRTITDDAAFWAWVADNQTIYARYLLTHPDQLVRPLLHPFDAPGSLDVFTPTTELRATALNLLPDRSTDMFALLFVAPAILALLAARARRADRRFLLPVALLCSYVPHQLLVEHGAPIDTPRHGVLLAAVMAISGIWTAALAIDVGLRTPEGANADMAVASA